MPPKKNQKHDLPALLSFFFPGFGQLVKGQVLKAILIWLAGAILFVLPLVILLLFFGFSLNLQNFPEDIISRGTLFLIVLFMWFLVNFSCWAWNVHDAYNAN